MIRLEVNEYCHSCPRFEAKTIGPIVTFANDEIISVGDAIVQCENVSICEMLTKYLKEHKYER